MDMSVLDQVRRIAADLFDLPIERIGTESSSETIDQWDSLAHLNFALSLEEAFDVQLEPEEIEEMVSIGQAAKTIEAARSRRSAWKSIQ